MSGTIFAELIDNLALLLAVGTVYSIFPIRKLHLVGLWGIALGSLVGLIGIFLMRNPLPLVEGIFFDTRTILIGVAGLFLGWVPMSAACVWMVAYRIFVGGPGVYMGVTTVLLSAVLGVLWHFLRFARMAENKKQRVIHLFVLGFVIHAGMLLCMFLLPSRYSAEAIRALAVPVLTLYPIGFFLLGLLLFSQYDREQVGAKLKESEELHRVTLLSVGDGVITTDADGIITMVNEAAEFITGWKADQVKGKSFNKLFRVVNEYTREPVDDLIAKVLRTGTVIGLANHSLYLREDGGEVPIADSAAPIIRDNGSVSGVVLVIRDVTKEREKQNEIEYLSYRDKMTGLFNRAYFDEQLRLHDNPQQLPLTIIIGDVNGLKMTNDAFGHTVGDQLLREMGRVVQACCPVGGIAARWGGDELAILLPQSEEVQAEELCDLIKAQCAQVKIASVDFSISLGYEVRQTMDESMESVLKKAEDYMYRKKSIDSISMRGNTINMILSSLHEKSPREQQHSQRVGELCRSIGKAMRFSDREVADLRLSGLMHDIGKIGVDESILNKKEKLTEEEFKEIKRHPEVGYRILRASSNMSYIADYVLSHHERLDGTGYPRKLMESEISIQSKILAVADSFDAMTSDRPYRGAMPTIEALQELHRNIGTQFDARVVCALEGCLKQGGVSAGLV